MQREIMVSTLVAQLYAALLAWTSMASARRRPRPTARFAPVTRISLSAFHRCPTNSLAGDFCNTVLDMQEHVKIRIWCIYP